MIAKIHFDIEVPYYECLSVAVANLLREMADFSEKNIIDREVNNGPGIPHELKSGTFVWVRSE